MFFLKEKKITALECERRRLASETACKNRIQISDFIGQRSFWSRTGEIQHFWSVQHMWEFGHETKTARLSRKGFPFSALAFSGPPEKRSCLGYAVSCLAEVADGGPRRWEEEQNSEVKFFLRNETERRELGSPPNTVRST